MIRILIILLFPVICLSQTNGKVIDGTLRVTQDAGTPTKAVGKNSAGDYHSLVPGDNVQIANDTITATGGGGNFDIPYGDIKPIDLVGINAANDTATWVSIDSLFEQLYFVYHIPQVVLFPHDTLISMRGSFLEAYEYFAWDKTVNAGVTDTLDIDEVSNSLDYDYSPGNGVFTAAFSNEELSINEWAQSAFFEVKPSSLNATISLSSSADTINTRLAIYESGFEIDGCVTEFTTLGSGEKITATISCQHDVFHGGEYELMITNESASNTTYTIERVNFNILQLHLYIFFTP